MLRWKPETHPSEEEEGARAEIYQETVKRRLGTGVPWWHCRLRISIVTGVARVQSLAWELHVPWAMANKKTSNKTPHGALLRSHSNWDAGNGFTDVWKHSREGAPSLPEAQRL